MRVTTQGLGDGAPSRRRSTMFGGGAPDAAAILQLFSKNDAFLGIVWSKFCVF